MAGVKFLTAQVKASSLIETIVAMMIVMLVFFVATTIYVNVLRNSVSLGVLSAGQQLQTIAEETKKNKSYFSETVELENITIIKTCTSYGSSDQLYLLDLEAEDKSGRVIANHKELILKVQDE